MITLKAYAKVNLTLEVLGRRDDGYHDIVSIIQTIDLADTLTLEPAEALTLECDDPGLQCSDNLVMRAASLLAEAAGTRDGARMLLSKGIPVAAGLGGGSSDAAAALTGLNSLWGLDLSTDELTPIAAQVGSDVPFFLHGGTAMVKGRGEVVRPLPPADLPHVLVLAPEIDLPNKTATVFGKLGSSEFTKGALTRKLEARIRGGGDVPPQFLFNAFDGIAFDAFPGLQEYWDTLYALGARELHLAGAGPSIFAPVSRREVGTTLQLLLTYRHGWRAYLVALWQPSRGEA
ncbi:MAG: 4-(cytidine 5'-diphospho)-2-C-methyl-D-erythritol kinase [Chloroflexi bacterium]|nr:4-(cytidine 5'-diphospho)-2-C-methyl-D-erythritol kinase [Chloroflexota bacterium]